MTRRLNLSATVLLVMAGVLTAAALAAAGEAEGSAAEPVREVVRSRVFTVDGLYRSMLGPDDYQILQLGDVAEPELLWVTGYRGEIVDPTAGKAVSPEFMCHNNLILKDMEALGEKVGRKRTGHSRLFTLSQGEMEVRFPEGFGIPVLSSEPLALESQVLNLNPQEGKPQVRHQVTIEYVRDRDLRQPMIPLFQRPAQAMVVLEGEEPAHFGVGEMDPESQGPGCAVGLQATESLHLYEDSFGRAFTAHWKVPPGREVHRTLVTHWLALPFDTTVHYVSLHVHPFAESLELRDLTTGETFFKAHMRNSGDRIGLDEVESFSSVEGVPIYKDHDYELVSVYDNTSGEEQDAMAIMYVYMRDQPATSPGDYQKALRQALAGSDTEKGQFWAAGWAAASLLAMLGMLVGIRRARMARA